MCCELCGLVKDERLYLTAGLLVSLQTSFIGYQARQVVLVLSDLQGTFLSPAQSVLLFQRCRLLLACLRYNNQLAQHLRSHYSEEFRCVLSSQDVDTRRMVLT